MIKKVEIDEILMPGDPGQSRRDERKVKSGFWEKMRKNAGRIPFSEDVVTAYYCAMDPKTPTRMRGLLLAALAYFIMPIDTIPDFLAGLGLTDDLSVLTVAITTIQMHVRDEHRVAARKQLDLTDPDTKTE